MAAPFTRAITAFAITVSITTAAGTAVADSPPAERDGVSVLSAQARWPGKIFVNHDECTFRDDVYTEDAAQFARNIAA